MPPPGANEKAHFVTQEMADALYNASTQDLLGMHEGAGGVLQVPAAPVASSADDSHVAVAASTDDSTH